MKIATTIAKLVRENGAVSKRSRLKAHADASAMVALRHLSERRAIQQTLAAHYHEDATMVERYEENAEAATHDIALLREILQRP